MWADWFCDFLKLLDVSVPLMVSVPAAACCLALSICQWVPQCWWMWPPWEVVLCLVGLWLGAWLGHCGVLQEQGHPAAQAAPSAATAYEHASSTLQVSSVKCWCRDPCPGVQGFREENVMLPASCPLQVLFCVWHRNGFCRQCAI